MDPKSSNPNQRDPQRGDPRPHLAPEDPRGGFQWSWECDVTGKIDNGDVFHMHSGESELMPMYIPRGEGMR